MTQKGVLRKYEEGRLSFYCPGCEDYHSIRIRPAPGPSWEFDGDYYRPTFSPSILVRSGHYVSDHKDKDCWCNYEERTGNKPMSQCVICHSYVRNGNIEFLSDCTHSLAGKTVRLASIQESSVESKPKHDERQNP